MQGNDWTGIAALITNVGFSVVVAWYLLSKAIPGIQDKFSADLKSQREDYHRSLERERVAYTDMLKIATVEEREMLRRNTEKTDRILSLLEDHLRAKARESHDLSANRPPRRDA